MFKKGQKVVCIDDSPDDGEDVTWAIKKDTIYTVTKKLNKYGCIWVDTVPDDYGNCGWSANRFAPLILN